METNIVLYVLSVLFEFGTIGRLDLRYSCYLPLLIICCDYDSSITANNLDSNNIRKITTSNMSRY